MHRKDVRVLKRGRDVDLAKEPLGTEPDRQLGSDHFDCDIAPVLEIAGVIDHRHSAMADLAVEAVAAR